MKPTIKNIDSGIFTGKAMLIELTKSMVVAIFAFIAFNFVFGV